MEHAELLLAVTLLLQQSTMLLQGHWRTDGVARFNKTAALMTNPGSASQNKHAHRLRLCLFMLIDYDYAIGFLYYRY